MEAASERNELANVSLFGEFMIPSPQQFERILAQVLSDLVDFQISVPHRNDSDHDYRVVRPDGSDFNLDVRDFKRITPATAESACLTLRRHSRIDHPFGKQLPKVLKVFSSKSSHVVREML